MQWTFNFSNEFVNDFRPVFCFEKEELDAIWHTILRVNAQYCGDWTVGTYDSVIQLDISVILLPATCDCRGQLCDGPFV